MLKLLQREIRTHLWTTWKKHVPNCIFYSAESFDVYQMINLLLWKYTPIPSKTLTHWLTATSESLTSHLTFMAERHSCWLADWFIYHIYMNKQFVWFHRRRQYFKIILAHDSHLETVCCVESFISQQTTLFLLQYSLNLFVPFMLRVMVAGINKLECFLVPVLTVNK